MTSRLLPSLTALKAFEATASLSSVTRAAEALGVTPGAVSQQIRELERQLAVALFTRTPGGLVLTEPGETLFSAAREGLDRIAAGVRAVRPPVARRPLVIGAYTHFASGWLIPRWGKFLARHPDIQIELSTTAQAEDLVPTHYDAVISVGPERRRRPIPNCRSLRSCRSTWCRSARPRSPVQGSIWPIIGCCIPGCGRTTGVAMSKLPASTGLTRRPG